MSLKYRRMTVVALVALVALSSTSRAGVISDMMAKRKMERQMKAQNRSVAANPFHGRGVGGEMSSPSFKEKFQKKFAVKGKGRNAPSTASNDRDSSAIRTSR